ncbi:hypothetical protein CC1G_06517 [Coprinopsis cinerea okayama7|uniref:O-acyltransferase WSD1 C-terminal domain-containing protein n=1 Tax=Coprinopsis cinerea (strain Okayama-7 / 130 / ATCC MYA-4618 / FGSC 9003) TaxID=240176 RepID=A8NNE4_COPC7|nr:hypothetical protein CC1G_06517 [Coprinopsis cinerea okayama7\|eukprot:XP_001835114.1 hypothetical protein CC1G_06517 [Coprinopsis cinerea okayama7\
MPPPATDGDASKCLLRTPPGRVPPPVRDPTQPDTRTSNSNHADTDQRKRRSYEPEQAEHDTIYPLTLYDLMGEGTSITTGWLVRGYIDVNKLGEALDRVVEKWPLLGGRLEMVGERGYQIRVSPPNSSSSQDPAQQPRKYVLTSSRSTRSLAQYGVTPSLLSGRITHSLPPELFMHEKVRKNTMWRRMKHYCGKPLTFWHVTHIRGGSVGDKRGREVNEEEGGAGEEYSCIGIHFTHGLFDGLGLSLIVHAVEAELSGREWDVPPLPSTPGLQRNALEDILEGLEGEQRVQCATDSKRTVDSEGAIAGKKYNDREQVSEGSDDDEFKYRSSIVGLWFCFVWFVYYMWQFYFHKRKNCIVVLPKRVWEGLVEKVRREAAASFENSHGNLDESGDVAEGARLSTGDIITAWLIKTIYSDTKTPPSKLINTTGMASLRPYFAPDLNHYPHNCFIPIPFPLLKVGRIREESVLGLARIIREGRKRVKKEDASLIWRRMKEAVGCITEANHGDAAKKKGFRSFIPFDAKADEHITISNISVARVVDVDWSGAICHTRSGLNQEGLGKVMCRYKYMFGSSEIVSNVVTVAGRLGDGGLVLDVVLIERRMKKLEEAVRMLVQEFGATVDRR